MLRESVCAVAARAPVSLTHKPDLEVEPSTTWLSYGQIPRSACGIRSWHQIGLSWLVLYSESAATVCAAGVSRGTFTLVATTAQAASQTAFCTYAVSFSESMTSQAVCTSDVDRTCIHVCAGKRRRCRTDGRPATQKADPSKSSDRSVPPHPRRCPNAVLRTRQHATT